MKDLLIKTLMESDEFVDALEAHNSQLARISNRMLAHEDADKLDDAAVLYTYYVACFTDACRDILSIP